MRCKRDKLCTNSCNVFSAVLIEPTATAHSEPRVVLAHVEVCIISLTEDRTFCGQKGGPRALTSLVCGFTRLKDLP